MADENPVPDTLQTIATKIDTLSKSIDERFNQVDERFNQVDARFNQVDARFNQVDARFSQVDARFNQVDERIDQQVAEVRSQLGVQIEAVHAEVKLVYDVVIAQQRHNEQNEAEHKAFLKRIEGQDVRLLAIEKRE